MGVKIARLRLKGSKRRFRDQYGGTQGYKREAHRAIPRVFTKAKEQSEASTTSRRTHSRKGIPKPGVVEKKNPDPSSC